MDAATSAVTTLTTIFSSFWSFVTSNPLIMILMLTGLVGAGIGLFNSIKGKLTKKK